MLPITAIILGCVAGLFSFAAATKIVSFESFRATIVSLGVPIRAAKVAGQAVIVGEILVVGLLLTSRPEAIFPLSLLALNFAAAGAVALLKDDLVGCACFGKTERRLGWSQLLALPLWLSVAYISLYPPRLVWASVMAFLVTLTLAAAPSVVRVISVARSSWSLRRAIGPLQAAQ